MGSKPSAKNKGVQPECRPLESSGAVSEEVSCAAERYESARIGYLSHVSTAKPVRNSPGIGGAKSTSEQNLLATQPTFADAKYSRRAINREAHTPMREGRLRRISEAFSTRLQLQFLFIVSMKPTLWRPNLNVMGTIARVWRESYCE